MRQLRFFNTSQNDITFTTLMKKGNLLERDLLRCVQLRGFHY
jgi:hypothetical protein